jgi:UDP-N-acetylmuramoylalanine--D-glutamate ligase
MVRDLHNLLLNPSGAHAVVVGGGKTGAAAARLLMRLGARTTLVDDAPLEKVRAGLAKHGVDDSVTLEVRAGGIPLDVMEAAELVVLSPGVPRTHPALAAALSRGVPCINEIELAAAHLPRTTFIGITGTNGKSTTTTIAGCIARSVDAQAFVGGNLGTPLCLAVLDGASPSIAVLELSSYQLETITALPLRAAIVTNLSPDHLDRYPNVDAYYAAKARIFDLVTAQGGVSLNAHDATSMHVLRDPHAHTRLDFDVAAGAPGVHLASDALELRVHGTTTRIALDNAHLVGRHNHQNAAAAVAAAALCGIDVAHMRAGLATYAGIEHRLERVGVVHGVTWFNDSKATNVDAAVTALRSFSGRVHLIAGGLGKGSSYDPLVEVARDRVVAVYTIGSDAPLIAQACFGRIDVVDAGELETACALAMARAVPGDVLLLSPACASFDQFRDYAARGERFRALFAATSSSSLSASVGHA